MVNTDKSVLATQHNHTDLHVKHDLVQENLTRVT